MDKADEDAPTVAPIAEGNSSISFFSNLNLTGTNINNNNNGTTFRDFLRGAHFRENTHDNNQINIINKKMLKKLFRAAVFLKRVSTKRCGSSTTTTNVEVMSFQIETCDVIDRAQW